VIDEAGKSRKSVVDALGRMTQVFEDPAGLNYQTDYSYDALSNLLSVTQRGSNSASTRYRTFTYDSLSRLLCAANPEVQAVMCPASSNAFPAGAITYGYDANGNLLTKIAPAPNSMAVPGVAGTGSASVGGTEQSVTYPATAGSGAITLSGSEQSTPPTGSTGNVQLNFSTFLYLGASVSTVVNGSTAGSASVPKGGSGCMVAQSLTSSINGNSSSLVTASSSCPGNNYGTVLLSSKSTGSQTNYPVSTPCSQICSYVSATSPMSGGTNGTPDTGTVSVTVNGFTASAQYGSGSTPGSVASALASALSASGSPVTGSVNGSVITIKATQSGASSNYPLSSSVTWNSQLFSKSSFTSAPSGSSLTGGVNAVTVYDNGTVWLTVNGCQASTTYGQSSTAAGLAATLANGVNAGNCAVNATAAGSGIALTATSTGSNTDYCLSSGSSTNLPAQFSPPAFTVAASGTSLTGGANEQITLTTTSYTYDALNRPLSVTHSNPSNANAAWAYDGTPIPACPGITVPTLNSPTNLIGRRSSMCSQESTSSFSYDPMGRVIAEIRSIGLSTITTNSTAYTYYKDGSLNKLTYPSGDVVTYTVGGASRVTKISDAANNFVVAPTTLPMYAPHGVVHAMTQGSGITTKNDYDVRLRPSLLSAGPAAGPVFSLNYNYYANGNVNQVLDNVDSTRSTSFSYDALNRLIGAGTVNTTSTNCWGEAYTIDAWGNLTNIAGASGFGGSCHTETLNAAPATTANRLTGYCYDAAGNLVLNSPCPSGTFTPTYYYDAENRLYNPQALYTYFYDADGVRIRKAASAPQGTMYWPGPSGQYLMETNGSGTISEEYIYFSGDRIARIDRPSGTVHYYFSDELQSASLITDPSGNVQERYYYYPYGGIRTSTGSDNNHYLFTGKERDVESGLDMFGARYYGSSLGRFMTPDWANKPINVPYANFGNPQSLNLYSYVKNNPTTTRDPDGHCPWCLALAGGGVLADEAPLAATGPVGWTVIGVTALGVIGYEVYQAL
jgi:RHS repeat-associated protein